MAPERKRTPVRACGTGLGSIMCQLPAGALADHFDHLRILAASCVTTLLAMGTLPLAIEHPALMWPVRLTMGASLGSFYLASHPS